MASTESIDSEWRGSGAGGVRSAIPKREGQSGGFFKRSIEGLRKSVTGSSSGKDGSTRDMKRSSTSRRRQARSSLEDHQLKCFTKWWQSVLPPGTHCHDLTIDIQSSFLLVQALEILSGKSVPNVKRAKKEGFQAANKFTTLANFDSCIKYMTDTLGIKLINVTSTGLADGDSKQVIIVSWALIEKFDKIGGTKGGGAPALLEWVKRTLVDYPGIELEGTGNAAWESGFNDGRVFSALVDSRKPGSFLPGVEHAAMASRIDAVFTAMARRGAPRLLDVNDLLTATEPKESVITYVNRMKRALGQEGAACVIQASIRGRLARRRWTSKKKKMSVESARKAERDAAAAAAAPDFDRPARTPTKAKRGSEEKEEAPDVGSPSASTPGAFKVARSWLSGLVDSTALSSPESAQTADSALGSPPTPREHRVSVLKLGSPPAPAPPEAATPPAPSEASKGAAVPEPQWLQSAYDATRSKEDLDADARADKGGAKELSPVVWLLVALACAAFALAPGGPAASLWQPPPPPPPSEPAFPMNLIANVQKTLEEGGRPRDTLVLGAVGATATLFWPSIAPVLLAGEGAAKLLTAQKAATATGGGALGTIILAAAGAALPMLGGLGSSAASPAARKAAAKAAAIAARKAAMSVRKVPVIIIEWTTPKGAPGVLRLMPLNGLARLFAR